MPYLTLKAANALTPYINKDGATTPSLAGHVWMSLKKEYNSIPESYGFAPTLENQGKPLGKGKIHDDDDANYILDSNDYQRTVYITEAQYKSLQEFSINPENNGFPLDYFLIKRDCIDFIWTALTKSGLNPTGFKGDLIPEWNADNFNTLLDGIEANIDPWDITLKYTTPNDLGFNNSQFVSAIADYYQLDAATTINFNPDYFSNTLIGFNGEKISAYSGNVITQLQFADLTLKNVDLSDYVDLHQDGKGNNFSIVKNESPITLKDNTTSTLGTVINAIDSATKAFDNFIGSTINPITTKLFGIEANTQGLAAEIALALASGSNLEDIATKIALREILISPTFDKIALELNGVFTDSKELDALRESLLNTQDSAEQLNILTQKLGSENEALTVIDFQKLQNSPMFQAVEGAIIQFAVISTIDQIGGGDKMNSEQYAEAAAQIITQQAVTLGVSSYFGTKATPLTPATISPVGFGVGVGVSHLASAAIRDLFADDHMNSQQWKSTAMTAAAMGATAGAIGGAAVAMGLIQAGALLGPIGFAIGIVAAVIVTQVFGGKKYGAGEYPDPYSYLKIEAKEDGTGNKIIGIEKEGVVAIAREYYHDDLYGNSGSDNLIGKSGTNTIFGYAGNDTILGGKKTENFIANDNSKNILKIPQTELMNHH